MQLFQVYSPKKFGFVIAFAIGLLLSFRLEAGPVLRYDSSEVKTISPGKEKEQKLFADEDLHYVREATEEVNWFERFINWLMDSLFGKTDYKTRYTVSRIILWTLVLAAVGVIIWLLTKTEFGNFIRGKVSKTEFSFSDVEEDIKAIDFNKRIKDAVAGNDLRLAIRWHYLKELNTLNAKGLVEWQPYKTNIDYSNELSKTQFAKTFRQLSNIYDYVWYGKYEISKDNYIKFEEVFNDFERSLA